MTADTGRVLASAGSRNPAILAVGLRPFYLLAAAFAVLALPTWLLFYTGITRGAPGMNGLAWHIHEMLFGFAPAVIAGFLLTAVRNWTGQPTATGAALASLALLWVVGRAMIVTGPVELAAFVDSAFLPALGVALAIPIWRSRNRRNVKVLGIVATLAILNIVFHLAYLGLVPGTWMSLAYTTGLDVVAILIAIMAGRVIPVFTANAIPDASPQRFVALEIVAIGTLIGVAIVDLVNQWWQPPTLVLAGLLAIAAAAHAARLAFWSPLRTRRNLLLLMLPLAYAWLPVHLALRVLATLGLSGSAAATHALTIGAMAGLMIAMMTRSALGHTGRALRAGKAEIGAFALIQLAALIRVAAAAWMPAWTRQATLCSGLLWTLGFLVFLAAYWPKLTQPRVDGKPG